MIARWAAVAFYIHRQKSNKAVPASESAVLRLGCRRHIFSSRASGDFANGI